MKLFRVMNYYVSSVVSTLFYLTLAFIPFMFPVTLFTYHLFNIDTYSVIVIASLVLFFVYILFANSYTLHFLDKGSISGCIRDYNYRDINNLTVNEIASNYNISVPKLYKYIKSNK